jgi:hypothetical protein
MIEGMVLVRFQVEMFRSLNLNPVLTQIAAEVSSCSQDVLRWFNSDLLSKYSSCHSTSFSLILRPRHPNLPLTSLSPFLSSHHSTANPHPPLPQPLLFGNPSLHPLRIPRLSHRDSAAPPSNHQHPLRNIECPFLVQDLRRGGKPKAETRLGGDNGDDEEIDEKALGGDCP